MDHFRNTVWILSKTKMPADFRGLLGLNRLFDELFAEPCNRGSFLRFHGFFFAGGTAFLIAGGRCIELLNPGPVAEIERAMEAEIRVVGLMRSSTIDEQSMYILVSDTWSNACWLWRYEFAWEFLMSKRPCAGALARTYQMEFVFPRLTP